MVPGLPEARGGPRHPLRPEALRAVASTSAAAAALGIGVGLLDHSILVGALCGALAAALRLGFVLRRWARRGQLPVVEIDPWALPEPWRGLVSQAIQGRQRFRQASAAWPEGPLRDRIETLGGAVEAQVVQVWQAACQGASLTGGYPPGTRVPQAADLSARLQEVQQEMAILEPGNHERRMVLDGTEQALAAQLRAARRAESVASQLRDRLSTIVAGLDDLVVSVVQLTSGPGGAADVENLFGAVGSMSQELSALQASITDTVRALLPGTAVDTPRNPNDRALPPSLPGARTERPAGVPGPPSGPPTP